MIFDPFSKEFGDLEPGFGFPVKFCAGTHRFQNFWTSVKVFRHFWPFLAGIRVGFGRMFAEGEHRKMVRKRFNSSQKRSQDYQIEEQDMAEQIFGVPGPGEAQKGRK